MEYETVIIGAGVAAAAVSRAILQRKPGHKMLILEAGPKIASRERRAWWDYVISDGKRTNYDHCHDLPLPDSANPTMGENESVGSEPWQFAGSRMMGYGGSTFHWGGWSLRFKPEDFRVFTNTGRGADWPINYDDLKSYYAKAEQLLCVSGEDKPNWTPRDEEYPLPPFAYTAADKPMIDAFHAMNIRYAPMPIARYRRCMTTGTCKYCPLGARFAASQILDEIADTPLGKNLAIHTRSAVRELVMDRRDRVVAVRCFDAITGKTELVYAQQFIICSGTYETPKLLLQSRSRFWNDGVGNDYGHVGRYLISHPFLYARGYMKTNPKRYQQELDFPTLMSRHFDNEQEQPHGKLFLFRDRSKPRCDLAGLMIKGNSRDEIDEIITGRTEWEIQGFMEEFANPANYVSLGKGLNRLGLPQTRVDYRRHGGFREGAERHLERMRMILTTMGLEVDPKDSGVQAQRGDHAAATCRMSKSPEYGVVNENLRVHDVANLYCCSNAVFPSGAAVNPTLTVTALAIRLGEHLGQ